MRLYNNLGVCFSFILLKFYCIFLIASVLLLMRQKAVCVIARTVKLSRSRDGICILKVSSFCFHCLQIPHFVLFSPTNLLYSAGNITDQSVSCKYILGANFSGPWQQDEFSMGRDASQPILALGQGSASCPGNPSFLVTSAISHKQPSLLTLKKYTQIPHFPCCGMASAPAVTSCPKTRGRGNEYS